MEHLVSTTAPKGGGGGGGGCNLRRRQKANLLMLGKSYVPESSDWIQSMAVSASEDRRPGLVRTTEARQRTSEVLEMMAVVCHLEPCCRVGRRYKQFGRLLQAVHFETAGGGGPPAPGWLPWCLWKSAQVPRSGKQPCHWTEQPGTLIHARSSRLGTWMMSFDELFYQFCRLALTTKWTIQFHIFGGATAGHLATVECAVAAPSTTV